MRWVRRASAGKRGREGEAKKWATWGRTRGLGRSALVVQTCLPPPFPRSLLSPLSPLSPPLLPGIFHSQGNCLISIPPSHQSPSTSPPKLGGKMFWREITLQ